MKINWDVETSSGGTYDSGAYRVQIKSIENVQAQSGNEQLRVKTVFLDGPYEGKQLTDHITLVESCDWKLVKFIKAVGMDIDELKKTVADTNSPAFRNLLHKIVGRTTIWTVGQKTRDDQIRNVILDYNVDPEAEEKQKETKWLE